MPAKLRSGWSPSFASRAQHNARVDHQALRLRSDVDSRRGRHIDRLWCTVDDGAVLAFALFFVFAIFLPLSLHLALAVPVLLFVVTFVMVVTMTVVMGKAAPWCGEQRSRQANRQNGKNLVHKGQRLAAQAAVPRAVRDHQSAQA